MSNPSRFGVIGNGGRAKYFHQIAAALPGLLEVAGVVTKTDAGAERARSAWNVATYGDIESLVSAQRPDFVICAVPREAAPHVLRTCVRLGVHVMCETPPATDLAGMRALWKDVHSSELVQVAEQYLLLPGHVARRKLLEQGVIGRPTSVQVSSTHLYHAASMIRGFLGAGFGPTNVNAQDFIAPLVNPVSRDGWATDLEPHPLTTTIATIDFGDTMGLYDFTENQWRNQLRSRRIVIRGTRGEISNDDVVRLGPGETYLQSSIIRRQIGYDLDLDGYDTDQLSFDGMTIWSNPFRGARFADEEIAIATLLTGMADWVRGEGPAPYPLADACQDHLIGCAIESSAASGVTVRTKTEAWAAA